MTVFYCKHCRKRLERESKAKNYRSYCMMADRWVWMRRLKRQPVTSSGSQK